MWLRIEKLILGRQLEVEVMPIGAIRKRMNNIRAIWNNEYDNDTGLEKLLRLFLAVSQFVFPGLYIKEIFSYRLKSYQDIAVDLYVLCKLFFPVFILFNDLQQNRVFICILVWLMIETILYVPTLIFASDTISRPRSYRRSMLLLFINYLEIIFDFGVLYASGDYLNRPFTHWFDSIYFSFITSATIGFGDFYPASTTARFLVSFQSTLFIIFVALFLNFFTGKVESKGYFGENKDQ